MARRQFAIGDNVAKLYSWIETSLQGITFWTGYRRCYYRHYPLGEAAFVAELCNLIHTHLDNKNFSLECEVHYKDINKGWVGDDFADGARADLVVFKGSRKDVQRENPIAIMEIKRGSSATAEINKDLRRLARMKKLIPECRTFLLLICESQRPDQYTKDNSTAKKVDFEITDDPTTCYRVRRVCKAHSTGNIERSQYACCLEVLDRPPKQKKSDSKKTSTAKELAAKPKPKPKGKQALAATSVVGKAKTEPAT